jgi:hypothetical protein
MSVKTHPTFERARPLHPAPLNGLGACQAFPAHLRAPRGFYRSRHEACFGVSISVVACHSASHCGLRMVYRAWADSQDREQADLGGRLCQCTALGGFKKAGFVLQGIILG